MGPVKMNIKLSVSKKPYAKVHFTPTRCTLYNSMNSLHIKINDFLPHQNLKLKVMFITFMALSSTANYKTKLQVAIQISSKAAYATFKWLDPVKCGKKSQRKQKKYY